MLFLLNFPAEPPSWQYALGGLIACGLYLLVTRGRGLRRPASQAAQDEMTETAPPTSHEEERRAA